MLVELSSFVAAGRGQVLDVSWIE